MRDPSNRSEADRPRNALPVPRYGEGGASSLEPVAIRRLKRRADFLHAGKGKRWHGKTLSLHAAPARPSHADPAVARIGFTLTKKVGNAVVRNRARRRLKEALRLCIDLPAKPNHDYVVIGRIEAVRLPFTALGRDLLRALEDVHGARAGGKARGVKAQSLEQSDAKPSDTKPRDIRR